MPNPISLGLAADKLKRLAGSSLNSPLAVASHGIISPTGVVILYAKGDKLYLEDGTEASLEKQVQAVLVLDADASIPDLVVPENGLRLVGYKRVLEITSSLTWGGDSSGVLDIGDCGLAVRGTTVATCQALAIEIQAKVDAGQIVGNLARHMGMAVVPNSYNCYGVEAGGTQEEFSTPIWTEFPSRYGGEIFPVTEFSVLVLAALFGDCTGKGYVDSSDYGYVDTGIGIGSTYSLGWWCGTFYPGITYAKSLMLQSESLYLLGWTVDLSNGTISQDGFPDAFGVRIERQSVSGAPGTLTYDFTGVFPNQTLVVTSRTSAGAVATTDNGRITIYIVPRA